MNAKYFGMTTALLVAGLSSATIAQAGSGHVGSAPHGEDDSSPGGFESTTGKAAEKAPLGSGHVDDDSADEIS